MPNTIITVGPAPNYTPDNTAAKVSLSGGVTFVPTAGNPFKICADSAIGNGNHHEVTSQKHFDLTGHKVGDVIAYSTNAPGFDCNGAKLKNVTGNSITIDSSTS